MNLERSPVLHFILGVTKPEFAEQAGGISSLAKVFPLSQRNSLQNLYSITM